ncbi:MAG: phosphatase PAP2 family protein [Betaproteobacteria bacterium]|nr:phosphatase PAP2 family protein [Betaproteobacteria bacterium]
MLRTLKVLRSHFWLKSVGTSSFMLVFFVAYFYLLKHPDGHVTTMPLTALDRWIGFQPWALPIYLSLWVYVSLPPALMASRSDIIGFGTRIGALCLIGLAVFYVCPTKVPPVSIDFARHPDFSILKGVDAGGNACPSLHVATAVFAAFWLDRMAPGLGFGTRMRGINALWCAAIAYSTIATGQHVAVDVLAGAALGATMALLTRPRLLLRQSAGDLSERVKAAP